jgi:uncharacterized protein YgiM (DUF1202 family)
MISISIKISDSTNKLEIKSSVATAGVSYPIAKNGESIKIITPNNRARLCKKPNAGENEYYGRIKTNTNLKVEDVNKVSNNMFDVVWYKVKYNNKTGWVSEYDTSIAPGKPRYK